MAAKKAADQSALTRLKEDLKAGNPQSLYFFFGEEVWLRDACITKLKEIILPKGLEDFNLHTLEGKACNPEALSNAIDALPVMSARSLVLVRDYDIFKSAQRDFAAYTALLADLPPYICLVFIYDTIKMDKRTIKGDLGKQLRGSPALVQFSQQDNRDLIPWVQQSMKKLDKKISRTDAEYLIYLTGGMMSNLQTEIGKVSAYAKDAAVTRADIDAVCEPVLDAVVFRMTDEIARGNFSRAAEILADLLAMEQPGIMILSVLGKQIRQLYVARLALEGRKGQDWLMETCDIKTRWTADKLLENAGRFLLEWYRTAVMLTAEADRTMKLSYREEKAILTELLARLSEASVVC